MRPLLALAALPLVLTACASNDAAPPVVVDSEPEAVVVDSASALDETELVELPAPPSAVADAPPVSPAPAPTSVPVPPAETAPTPQPMHTMDDGTPMDGHTMDDEMPMDHSQMDHGGMDHSGDGRP